MYALVREQDLPVLLEEGFLEFEDEVDYVAEEHPTHEGKPGVVSVHIHDDLGASAVIAFFDRKLPMLAAIPDDPDHNEDGMDSLGLTLNGVVDWQNTAKHRYKAGRPIIECDHLTGEPRAADVQHLKEFQEALRILLYEEFGLVNRTEFPI